jgi:hypothetical protein
MSRLGLAKHETPSLNRYTEPMGSRLSGFRCNGWKRQMLVSRRPFLVDPCPLILSLDARSLNAPAL